MRPTKQNGPSRPKSDDDVGNVRKGEAYKTGYTSASKRAGSILPKIVLSHRFAFPLDNQEIKAWGAFDDRTGLTCFSDPLHCTGAIEGPETFLVVCTAGQAQIAPNALDRLSHFSDDELYRLVVPKRTLARRLANSELLSVEETDKAVRLGRINQLAEKVFGDPAKAHRWLRKSKERLGGETPLDYLSSEAGARIVEEMLEKIDYGIFA